MRGIAMPGICTNMHGLTTSLANYIHTKLSEKPQFLKMDGTWSSGFEQYDFNNKVIDCSFF